MLVPDSRHTPPGDLSFYVSLLRHFGSAVALVTVVAAAFWGVGQMRSSRADVAIDDAPATEAAAAPSAPAAATAQPTTSVLESSLPSPTGEPAAPATTAGSGATASPPPAETPTSQPDDDADTVPPSETSVQVLNGVGLGSDAGQRVADMLAADGYDIVVVQAAAVAYDTSTVFWTPGHEAEARQLADAYGFSAVAEKPSNLSDDVDVHIVVGTDRA